MATMEFTQYQGLPWIDVESSNLARVAWVPDPGQPENLDKVGTLYVEFGGGRAYAYAKVGEVTYGELLEAESAGSFFNTEVKAQYETERIEVQ